MTRATLTLIVVLAIPGLVLLAIAALLLAPAAGLYWRMSR